MKIAGLIARRISLLLVIALLPGTLARAQAQPAPRYIFIFLADGGSITHLEIARLFNRRLSGEGLVTTDKIVKEGSLGLLTTHALDLLVTDSAAAATALASGCKTTNGTVGICGDGSRPKTVLEIAKEKGMRIGLVTNSTVYDATPAAFASHVSTRRNYNSIVDQYLRLEPDLLLGGGRDRFLPSDQPGSRRSDTKDMIRAFRAKGYEFVSDRQALSAAKPRKVLGLFSPGVMSLEIDRGKNETSLYDMTREALRILADGKKGFALLVENEHVDTAGHLTDLPALVQEIRAFDRAVALAYDFYRKHPAETLLVVTSDHDTGGVALAGSATFQDLEKIRSVGISIAKALEILGEKPSPAALDRLLAQRFDAFVLEPDLREAILKRKPVGPPFPSHPVAGALSAMVSRQTNARWASSRHTNQPVFVAAIGPGSERFRGYQDNTDFAKHLFALLRAKGSF